MDGETTVFLELWACVFPRNTIYEEININNGDVIPVVA